MAVQLRVVQGGASNRARSASSEAHAPLGIVVPLETAIVRSIEGFDQREWDGLFPGELEDWNYLRALERAQLVGCEPTYFSIRSRGELVAAVPAFVGRRALGEPWRVRARAQWRKAPARALVLGSPLSAACRIGFAPRAHAAMQARIAAPLVRAARDESARLGLDGLFVSGDDAKLGNSWRAAALRVARKRRVTLARISLPCWSLTDYLTSLERDLRDRLLRVCARAAQYERDWHVDSRDFEAILALCREAGLTELNESFFRNLVGSSTVRASCLLVRVDGKLAGFSLVLLDSIALHEKLTVVSRRVKGDPVRSVLWLETLRFCLECGIGTYVSASELSLAVARPNELVNRSGWPGV